MSRTTASGRSIAAAVLLALACLSLMTAVIPREYRPAGVSFSPDSSPVTADPVVVPQTGGIDLNTADAETLEMLPGVGVKLAQAILDERENNGTFSYPEDVMAVSGIGEKKFAAMQDMIDTISP